MKRKIITGLIEVISHIFIFFFVKHQLTLLNLDWYIIAFIGTLLYLISSKLTENIKDRSQQNFIQGLLITTATTCFFIAFQPWVTQYVIESYSYLLLGIGIILYLVREFIADIVLGE